MDLLKDKSKVAGNEFFLVLYIKEIMMISKEQIAHGLTMVYLSNRYGVDVNGDFNVDSSSIDENITEVEGSGSVETNHFPNAREPKFIKVETGEKGFLGYKKKKKVQSGYLVDDIFIYMVEDYYSAYPHFLKLLEDK